MQWIKDTSLAIKCNNFVEDIPFSKVNNLYIQLISETNPRLIDDIKTILCHIGYLMGIKLKSKLNLYNLDFIDLKQIAAIGTINAINDYNLECKSKFTTHMFNNIKYSLLRSQYLDGEISYSEGTAKKIVVLSRVVSETTLKGEQVSLSTILKYSNIKTLSEAKKLYYIYLLEHKKEEILSKDLFQVSAEEEFEKKEEIVELQDVLNSLEVIDKSIIELRYVQEKSISEISDLLNISKRTVSRRLKNSLLKLQQKLS